MALPYLPRLRPKADHYHYSNSIGWSFLWTHYWNVLERMQWTHYFAMLRHLLAVTVLLSSRWVCQAREEAVLEEPIKQIRLLRSEHECWRTLARVQAATCLRLALQCGSYLFNPAAALARFGDHLQAALNVNTCQLWAVHMHTYKSRCIQMVRAI